MMSAPSCLLDLDRAFGREHQRRAVEMRSKTDAFFVDRIDFRQAHRLEPARVGQHRAGKSHEARDAAQLADQLGARANREMVGVGEHHRVAHRPQLVGRHRLDGGARADRHEAGVAIAPCGVTMCPVRASPSRHVTLNSIGPFTGSTSRRRS